jgi:hypothetical protein
MDDDEREALVRQINADTAYLEGPAVQRRPRVSRRWYLLWWLPSHTWASDNTVHFLVALLLGIWGALLLVPP